MVTVRLPLDSFNARMRHEKLWSLSLTAGDSTMEEAKAIIELIAQVHKSFTSIHYYTCMCDGFFTTWGFGYPTVEELTIINNVIDAAQTELIEQSKVSPKKEFDRIESATIYANSTACECPFRK